MERERGSKLKCTPVTRARVVIDPNVEPLYSTDEHHDSCALSSTLQAKKKKIEVTVKKYTFCLFVLCVACLTPEMTSCHQSQY